ncbi:fumarylacetoacetate hydrolase family protein [uncultured Sulfitobacter sp.]|uniref:fumarylacetoacetate hydrolase family protein n=1 Tax=uncultured Sulfitobacter sp. TaxID=191468 RepID=UPI0026049C42|nr:fumarylacetoacetate hydrolase family protein [uncultured Sulfitobacter sp.]
MYVFTPPAQASLAVAGTSDRFPVRRIFCVGRNYAAHAREMGKDPDREAPFFFTKPADAALDTPCTVPYPPLTEDLHYEIELVIAIGKGGSNVSENDVMEHVWGASVGVDLTRRDLQAEAKEAGRPWDWAKAFDKSAPIAPIVPISDVTSVEQGRIWLAVNGETRQDADLSDLIWSVREHVSILSQAMELAPGDIIMTGTPAGVGAVSPGDVITGGVDGIGTLEVKIGPK